jgi:hypothetical protein
MIAGATRSLLQRETSSNCQLAAKSPLSWPITVLRQRYHIAANMQVNGLMGNLILKTGMEMALAMAVFKTTARCTHVTKVLLPALR